MLVGLQDPGCVDVGGVLQHAFTAAGRMPRVTPLFLSVSTMLLAYPSSVVQTSCALSPQRVLCAPAACLGDGLGGGVGLPRKRVHRDLLATVKKTLDEDRLGRKVFAPDNQRGGGSMATGGVEFSHNHKMCGESATCKQWEGLSCGEVDNIIHSVERYERVYSDANLVSPDLTGKEPPS